MICDQRPSAVLLLLLSISAISLFTHSLTAPIGAYGPDGQLYEKLGFRASQADDLFAKGNFGHAFWSPSWITTIAIIYKIHGRRPLAIRVYLAATALVIAVLVFAMARQAAGTRAALAATAFFLFGRLIYRFTTFYQYEVPLALVLALFGYLLIRNNRDGMAADIGPGSFDLVGAVLALVSGAVLAYGALISPRVYILIPLVAAVLWRQGGRRRLLSVGLPILAGILSIHIPWMIRNQMYFGEWIPGTTNGGFNLFLGHNPQATGGYFYPPPDQAPDHPHYDSAYWMHRAMAHIRDNPGLTLQRTLIKAWRAWNPLYLDQMVLLAAFAVGWVRFLRNRHALLRADRIWILGVPIGLTMVQMIFFYHARYMIPALPYVAIVAGAGLAGWRADRPSGRSGLPAGL